MFVIISARIELYVDHCHENDLFIPTVYLHIIGTSINGRCVTDVTTDYPMSIPADFEVRPPPPFDFQVDAGNDDRK